MRRHIDDDELLLLLDGDLPPRRRSRIADHLERCDRCHEKITRTRATMTDAGAAYRERFGGSAHTQAHDYGRVRLAAALRDAARTQPAWFDRLAAGLGGVSVSRGLGAGVVLMFACAAALFAARASSDRDVASLPNGALPQSSLTPGAVSTLTSAELCNGSRPSRIVMETVRAGVVRAYGMEGVPESAYELDALITPELGGSTDPANLWPQRYHSPVWNARVKDELERLLPEMVCRGEITLAEAQRDIATDWIAAYQRHFRTDGPLQAHLGAAPDEDPELLIVPDRPATQVATVRLVSR
jgi:hypothetical protein